MSAEIVHQFIQIIFVRFQLTADCYLQVSNIQHTLLASNRIYLSQISMEPWYLLLHYSVFYKKDYSIQKQKSVLERWYKFP